MTRGRLLVLLSLALLLVIGVISAIIFAKGDAWKEFALESVNENVSTNVEVGEVDITVWSTFPQISVDLHNVKIEGAKNRASDEASSLVEVEKLGVAFSLWDVLFGEPVIRSLSLNSGEITLHEFSSGKWNAEVFEGASEGSGVEITTISLIDVDFRYLKKRRPHSSVFISEATISEGVVDVSFDDLLSGTLKDVFVPLYGDLRFEYSVNENDEIQAQINHGTINDLSFSTTLNQIDSDSWTFEGACTGISQNTLESLLSDKNILEGLSYGGIAGLSFSGTQKSVEINFSLPESDFAIAPSITGLALNNTGTFSSTGSCVIDLSSLNYSLELDQVKIESNGLVLDFSGGTKTLGKEDINLKGKMILDLGSSYKSWLPELQGSEGAILPNEGEIEISGEIVIPVYGKTYCPHLAIESLGMSGKLNSIPYSIKNLRVELSKGEVNIKSCDFDWAGNVGGLTSKISDFERALDGGPVRGNFNIEAESIVMDPIMSWWDNNSDSDVENEATLLNLGSNIDYSITSETLLWEALECKQISSRGVISSSRLLISIASTKGLGGEATVQGSLRPGGPGWLLGLTGTASSVSLVELFRVYNNFGQEVVRTEHLEGRGDVAGSMHLGWSRQGDWVSNAFDADLEVSISNGRLYKLEMFDEVADYLKEHRLIAPLVDPEDLRTRLSDIEFDYVESPITVASSTVSVPFLKIQSSAMDVSIEGFQTFAGAIDYTLGFALRDLKNDKQGEFGNILDDGLGTMFFLGMGGTLYEPEYSYDREAHRAHRRRALSAEAERIKNALTGNPNEKEEEEEETPQVRTRKTQPDILDDPEDDDF